MSVLIAQTHDATRSVPRPVATSVPAVQVLDAYWGYTISSSALPPLSVVVAQTLTWCVGVCFLLAALGLWVMPAPMSSGADFAMKLALSSVLGGVAALFLWYASRGSNVEIQIDTALSEVREVVRNRAGRPTHAARHAFAEFGAACLDRKAQVPGAATLVLRFGNTTRVLPVVQGPVAEMEILRDRLGRDLLLTPVPNRRPR